MPMTDREAMKVLAEKFAELTSCDHQRSTMMHAFSFEPAKHRNIWNPYEPRCSKCGLSIGDIIKRLNELRAAYEHARRAKEERYGKE